MPELWVIKFPRKGYKIRLKFARKGYKIRLIFEPQIIILKRKFLHFMNRHSGKPSKIGHHFRK